MTDNTWFRANVRRLMLDPPPPLRLSRAYRLLHPLRARRARTLYRQGLALWGIDPFRADDRVQLAFELVGQVPDFRPRSWG